MSNPEASIVEQLPGRNTNLLNIASPNQASSIPVQDIDPDDWQRMAYCKDTDPNIFFPSGAHGVEIARKICADCVVKIPCLEYAIENRIDHGVWGGTSERERRRIIRSRATIQT